MILQEFEKSNHCKLDCSKNLNEVNTYLGNKKRIQAKSTNTFKEVCRTQSKIFQNIKLKVIKIQADILAHLGKAI